MITFDVLTLTALIEEQRNALQHSKIVKIQQPSRTEFLLHLRNNGETKQFYINIHPQFYHVCFRDKNRPINLPKHPPMFCMLLRKYIENSQITEVKQVENERILELYIKSYNEIAQEVTLCLAIELMGKHSNVILYNTETGIILGCAHNVGAKKSKVREVYGGIRYVYPPHKCNKFESFLDKTDIKKYPSLNDAICNYYSSQINLSNFKSLKNTLSAIVSKNLKKSDNTINKINNQIQQGEKQDNYRLYADLLMANLYNLKDYSSAANVFDYENNKNITIALDSSKSVKDNANMLYKKYNKLKAANEKYKELLNHYTQQKIYNEQLLYFIETSQNLHTLENILSEISPQTKEDKKSDNNRPETYKIDDNTQIFVGKNNKQNDYIVSKLSSDEDLWFHAHNCAGSHVLLKSKNPTDELILKCAKLAKENSKAKNSQKTGIIYTKRKYLKKPPSSPPGYVTYRNETEIIVD